jgi:hypothetical protein
MNGLGCLGFVLVIASIMIGVSMGKHEAGPGYPLGSKLAQAQYARDRAQFEGKSRAWLLKQARDRYRIEVPRGESDERIVDALTRASIIEKIDKQPPGSTPGQAPELRSDLQALGRGTLNDRKHRGDTVAGLVDLADLYEQSRQASKTGTVPPFTVNVARQIVAREGLDIRDAPGQKRMRQLLGMPEQPTGEQETLHANELGFGDVVSLGGFGGHVALVVEHDDGKVSITTFGPIGQTYTIPGDRQVKARLAERRGLAGMTQGARRESRLAREEHQRKVDAAYATMANAPSVYQKPADGRPSVQEVALTAGISKYPDKWGYSRTIDAPVGHSNEMISDIGQMDDIQVRAALFNPAGPGEPYRAEIFAYSDGRQLETVEGGDLKEVVGKLDKIFSAEHGGPMARSEGVTATFEVRTGTGVAKHQVVRIDSRGEERVLTAMSDKREAQRRVDALTRGERQHSSL